MVFIKRIKPSTFKGKDSKTAKRIEAYINKGKHEH